MADIKADLLKAIEEFLGEYARWARRAGGSRSDAVEEFYRELLNRAFGYQLKNMNRVKGNYPGIDLADDAAGVAVQVTTTETAEKVRQTLKQFLDVEKGLYSRYSRLIVAVAGDSKGKNSSYTTKGFDFQPGRDIWDIAGLLAQLQNLPQEKLQDIKAFLRRRIPAPTRGERKLNLPLRTSMDQESFIGRKKELDAIDEKLGKVQVVVLSGLGGMGKTELAIRYGQEYDAAGRGNTYFATFQEDFRHTILNSIAEGVPQLNRKGKPEEEVFQEVMAALESCFEEDLLILDNADREEISFEKLKWELKALPMRIIVTTRCDTADAIYVDSLSEEELHKLFALYKVDISKSDMDALIREVEGHTLAVDLIARSLRQGGGQTTVEELLVKLQSRDLSGERFTRIASNYPGGERQARINEHLRSVFQVSHMSEAERNIQRCATLLPAGGLGAAYFAGAFEEEMANWSTVKPRRKKKRSFRDLFRRKEPIRVATTSWDVVNDLVGNGWLTQRGELLHIHPVIRIACREELEPTEENCKKFLENVEKCIDARTYDKEKYRQLAELYQEASMSLEDWFGEWAGQAGHYWMELGNGQRAMDCNLLLLSHAEEHYYQDDPRRAVAYNNIGSTYGALGDHRQALEYDLKSLGIRERVLPPDHPFLATGYNNVGTTYGALGDHKQALEYKLKALEIWERVLPPEHPDIAKSYNNVGGSYLAMGDHEKTLEYVMKAHRIRERVLPPEHPDLARSYNNVGSTYYAQGNYEKALEYQQKALVILERVLPGNHPDLAMAYANVAMDYELLNNITEAATHMRRAAEIINRSTLPETHPKRVNYNKWAEKLEEVAQQVQTAE